DVGRELRQRVAVGGVIGETAPANVDRQHAEVGGELVCDEVPGDGRARDTRDDDDRALARAVLEVMLPNPVRLDIAAPPTRSDRQSAFPSADWVRVEEPSEHDRGEGAE